MIDKRPVTAWFADTLAAASKMPVGKARTPSLAADPPFYLVYSVDTRLGGAPLADRNELASFVYQVTSVSGPDRRVAQSTASLDQLEWMADKVRATFLGRDPATGLWAHPLTVPGVSCMARSLDVEWGGQPGGTSEQESAIMTYVQRIKLDLTSV